MNGKQLADALIHVARTIESNKDHLCELDSHVGDGDHGVSMTVGMRAARQMLANLPDPTPAAAFRAMGDAFADEVGASSGVLYEMSFAAAAAAAGDGPDISRTEQWNAIFKAVAQAIKSTGGAEAGDKTMLDAWQPAADALGRAADAGIDPAEALALAAEAAWNGVSATKNLIPKRGRASLLGERARGHQDAGATSAWLVIRALQEAVASEAAPAADAPVFSPQGRRRLLERLDPLSPSVLVWQAYAPFLAQGGTQAKAVEDVVSRGFFKSLEISVIDDSPDRRRIARTAADAGCGVMVWASLVQADEGLSLAAIDDAERRRSQKRFSELVRISAECGARRMGLCSPPDCDPRKRGEAIRHLGDGLAVLGRDAAAEGIAIVFEALDRDSHKKGLLGSSAELAELAARVRAEVPGFGVCWDTAHAALNGEDLAGSFRTVAPHTVLAHFADAVLDRQNRHFGDWHLPLGKGDVMKPAVPGPLAGMLREDCRQRHRPIVLAIEEYNLDPKISGADFLERAWSYLRSAL